MDNTIVAFVIKNWDIGIGSTPLFNPARPSRSAGVTNSASGSVFKKRIKSIILPMRPINVYGCIIPPIIVVLIVSDIIKD